MRYAAFNGKGVALGRVQIAFLIPYPILRSVFLIPYFFSEG